jgi:hypothetical protein
MCAPLTTRACADVLGVSPEWIRQAIDAGVEVARGRRVRLPAEAIGGERRTLRIHYAQFVTFLHAIGWRRLPAPADVQGAR